MLLIWARSGVYVTAFGAANRSRIRLLASVEFSVAICSLGARLSNVCIVEKMRHLLLVEFTMTRVCS